MIAKTQTSNKVLSAQAVEFLSQLHRRFNLRRHKLLAERQARQARLDAGEQLRFLPETAAIRANPSWRVAPTPRDLQRRWVEITGPTDAKMVINGLNSGADVFMADFEDANAPTWENVLRGQENLGLAIDGTLQLTTAEGKHYALNDKTAVLTVRPRGWHLPENHFLVDGEPIAGALFDFGLYFFHQAQALLKKGSGPYFYLPKLESYLEARLWNDVFVFAQEQLGIPQGTIRATVLIETLPAAFEMEEILYELRAHAAGLNAGRWDYLFSIIKKCRSDSKLLFPDRSQLAMTVPFMRAYARLLVQTCHRRGAHAIGGMAAFVPSRKDAEVNAKALAKVREDKEREVAEGFDGTWVAHPDLVAPARAIFAAAFQDRDHQKDKKSDSKAVSAADLLNFAVPNGAITESGVRQNIRVAIEYLDAWLNGTGAVAISNLMEDVATAEISRSQLWQWVHHRPETVLQDGQRLTESLYRQWTDEEHQALRDSYAKRGLGERKLQAARDLLDRLVLAKQIPDFLTLPGYEEL